MNFDAYWVGVLLMWAALPVTWLNYKRAWARLPERMATHFDAGWHANGWSSREDALTFALTMTAGLLVTFTLGAVITRVRKPTSAWPVLVIFYLALAGMWFANNSVIFHNLAG